MAYQDEGVHVNAGGGAEVFPLPNVFGPPDVAVAIQQAILNTGFVAAAPDALLAQINLDVPAAVGEPYYCVGRQNHSKLVLEFNSELVVLAPGVNVWAHGLSAEPEMYYSCHADQAGVANSFVVTGVDPVNLSTESFEVGNLNAMMYAWLLHSEEWYHTSDAIDRDLVPTVPLDIPHGLPLVPDLILAFPFQPPAGAAPNGAISVLGVDDTNVTLATTAAAGIDLPIRMFAQNTFSVQG